MKALRAAIAEANGKRPGGPAMEPGTGAGVGATSGGGGGVGGGTAMAPSSRGDPGAGTGLSGANPLGAYIASLPLQQRSVNQALDHKLAFYLRQPTLGS